MESNLYFHLLAVSQVCYLLWNSLEEQLRYTLLTSFLSFSSHLTSVFNYRYNTQMFDMLLYVPICSYTNIHIYFYHVYRYKYLRLFN